MGDDGIEHPIETSGNSPIPHQSGAESGAVRAGDAWADRRFAKIADAWPSLPDALKAAILAIIASSASVGGEVAR